MSLICKIIGCRWSTVHKTYGVLVGTTRIEIHRHCLRCGKRNPNE